MTTLNVTHNNLPEATKEILATLQKIETVLADLEAKQEQTTSSTDLEPYIYGIKGLAAFLKVSTPTAQKIKNSGRVPFSQAERTIVFRKSDVLRALLSKNKGGKKL